MQDSNIPRGRLCIRLFRELTQIAKMQDELQAFWADEIGVSVPQWMILKALRELTKGDGIATGDLAAKIPMDLSFLSSKLNSLIDKGLVQKSKSEEDKRVSLVFLTMNADSAFSKIEEQENTIDQFITAELQTSEIEQLVHQAEKLNRQLSKVPMIRKLKDL